MGQKSPKIQRKQSKNAYRNSSPSSHPKHRTNACKKNGKLSMVMIYYGPCRRSDLINMWNRSRFISANIVRQFGGISRIRKGEAAGVIWADHRPQRHQLVELDCHRAVRQVQWGTKLELALVFLLLRVLQLLVLVCHSLLGFGLWTYLINCTGPWSY